ESVRVDTHRETTRVPRRRRDRLGERPVAVVDEEVVVFLKIVRHVGVGTPIEIEIARNGATAEPADAVVAGVDTRGLADIDETPAIISKQAISRCTVRRRGLIALA